MTEMRTIVERGPTGAPDDFTLWGCRMTGRGCDSNEKSRTKRHCNDCYGPLPKSTTMPTKRIFTVIIGEPK
jgi:hypothetical protein